MAKINILPSKVYNRIAAGEVVDRPYSVVKELVENAIDAGATEVEIHVEGGGKRLIRVIDNGCGIAREDLHSAFLPHATSKISRAEDLDSILTLGFRGEAVASIASVSKMTITSKTEDGKCYELTSEGGEIGQITEVGGEKGTDVKVEGLFFNAPVRFKFLKSDKAEETDITNCVSRFILNRSDVAFAYYCDGKKVLQSFGDGIEEAVISVYGASVIRNCFKIDAERNGIRIHGYIGNQNFYKANKSYQSIFLNGRYIINTTIAAAINNAYSSYLMKRQYPFYVLHVEMPTEIVDVNVHPNKADVRFADNQVVYGSIFRVISAVLDGQTKALEYIVNDGEDQEQLISQEEANEKKSLYDFSGISETKKRSMAGAKKDLGLGFATLTYEAAKKEISSHISNYAKWGDKEVPFEEMTKGFISSAEINEQIAKTKAQGEDAINKKEPRSLAEAFPDLFFEENEISLERKPDKKEEDEKSKDYFAENKRYLELMDRKNGQNKVEIAACTYAGKLFNTYLLYECKDEVYIIDQHAAHERLIFDKLKEKMKNREIVQQPMLLPFSMSVNAFEGDFLREHIKDIREMGFEIFERKENFFEISSVPMDLRKIDLASFFHSILAEINQFRAIKLEEILKDKLASEACKAAVKGGMDLTNEEIDELFVMMNGDMGLKCPHGRPVVVKMSKKQLEKMFKRIV